MTEPTPAVLDPANPAAWAAQPFEALRRGEQAHEADVFGAALLEPVDSGNRRIGSGQHGRDDDDPAASRVLSHDIVQGHGRVPQLRCTGADAVEARARW